MHPHIGPQVLGDGVRFCVWAPDKKQVEVYLPPPVDRTVPMEQRGEYWECVVPGIGPGARYFYRLNGEEDRPDPASRLQPEGVHGASALVDMRFAWTDEAWRGIELHEHVLYELHVGTYTREGTFEAIIPHLENLRELGVTGIELMPIAQFPGERNWGYDGVYPFAPQFNYGGPVGLKRLVDAAHNLGIAVVLDVIYNHLGPEGNYFSRFGPYFTNSYKTPWGDAINFDGPYSRAVRDFFVTNAEYWIREFHIDGLRLDATHEMHDRSPLHILGEIQQRVDGLASRLRRQVHIFAESDANDIKYLAERGNGGYGLDAQWLDDFHHAIYSQMADTKSRRYDPDYGEFDMVGKTFAEGFVYSGQYCVSRKKEHGTNSGGIAPERLVVFMQNHDQVGNKPRGTRLAAEASFEAVKMAAAAYILSPYLPMLFMGEELLEMRPFMFFVDHSDAALIDAVREGRRRDFMLEDDTGEFPDPSELRTFRQCIIHHEQTANPRNGTTWLYYKELLRLRKALPAICPVARDRMSVSCDGEKRCAVIRREDAAGASLMILNFSQEVQRVRVPETMLRWPCYERHDYPAKAAEPGWRLALNSADEKWQGPGGEIVKVIGDVGEGVDVVVGSEAALVYCISGS